MKEFLREYKSLKQRYNKKQNLKIWDVLNQKKQGKAHFYFSSQKEHVEKDTKREDNGIFLEKLIYIVDQKKTISKRERQNELKSVLYETIKLTDTLKRQLKQLENSGLVYDSHPPKY